MKTYFTVSRLWPLVLGLCLVAGESAKASFVFGEPVNLRSVIPVITPPDSIDCVSFDGLEMYITSGQGHDNNLRMLRRASKDEDWGPLEDLGPGVNSPSPYDDSMSSISADGLTLYFHSSRPGGYGSTDIYMTTRPTRKDPWGPPVNLGPKVNSSFGENCPWISASGLELYFHSKRSGGQGMLDIWVTKRATTEDPWAAPVNLGPIVNSAHQDVAACVSPDGLVLFFSGGPDLGPFRPGGYGSADMWMARRASLSDPWQAPVNLGPKVNGPRADVAPRISPDGTMLYFATYEPGTWTAENWQASILPIVDFNADGKVDLDDLVMLIDNWGTDKPLYDIGPMPWGDGKVDIEDLKVFIDRWEKESMANAEAAE